MIAKVRIRGTWGPLFSIIAAAATGGQFARPGGSAANCLCICGTPAVHGGRCGSAAANDGPPAREFRARLVLNRRVRFAPPALILATTALLTAAYPLAAGAQAPERRLAAAKRLECAFSAVATGSWDANKPSAAVTPAEFSITFFNIDVDEGTAEADGGFGAAYISVRYSQGYLHLMQMSQAGPLHVTTIFASATTGGRLKAVQTRHEFSPTVVPGFTSRPEMYIGDCAIGAAQPASPR
jgi:hypothetical protein